jgi:hypothetical protein
MLVRRSMSRGIMGMGIIMDRKYIEYNLPSSIVNLFGFRLFYEKNSPISRSRSS